VFSREISYLRITLESPVTQLPDSSMDFMGLMYVRISYSPWRWGVLIERVSWMGFIYTIYEWDGL